MSKYTPIALNPEQQYYRKQLHSKLGQTQEYEGFISLIGKELLSYGVTDWSCTLLDLPDELSTSGYMGTVDHSLVQAYGEEELYKGDLILRHVQESDIPIFQSQVETLIETSPVKTASILAHKKILVRNKEFGYEDTYNIPIRSGINGARILLSLTSKGIDAERFRRIAHNKLGDFKTLAMAVNDIGIRQFPDVFVHPIEKYEAISNSQPLNVLVTMVEHDLTALEVAEHLGLSESSITKHLRKIRKSLNVKTNWAAYAAARRGGYIK